MLVALVALACSSPVICGEIHDVVQHGDLQAIKLLLDGNPDLIFSKDSLGLTPLHVAALTGRRDVVQLLLANKADVNARDKDGYTPLHWAADRGHKDLVKLLLVNRADINARLMDGETPLHCAVRAVRRQGYIEVVELL
jgi:ankyrin repeat protein